MTIEGFRVLGRIAVARRNDEVDLGATREAALLAALLVHANRVVATSRLIDDVWRGKPSPGARATLQTYIKNIRRVLEPDRASGGPNDRLLTRQPGYLLVVERDELDAAHFARLVDEGRAALAGEQPAMAAQRLRAAIDLWGGAAFGDLGHETYLQPEAARLEELHLSAIEDLTRAELALGRHAELCGELEALVEQHPWRERLWQQLMLAQYRSGRQTDALRAYQHVRHVLISDIGVEPGDALVNLEAAILRRDPELDWVPPRVNALSLSSSAVDVTRVIHSPAFRTPLIGRGQEVAALVGHLGTPAHLNGAIITLTGPGGVGKTRLALQVAATSTTVYPGGARLVSLAPVAVEDAVPEVVLMACGGTRHTGETALSALARLASDERLLVVLDNCEHVLSMAAECVDAIVCGGRSVVLATSREPLGIPSEHIVAISGLDEDAAIALFVDRSQAIDSTFRLDDPARAVVKEICRRLDALPLAIELAAARTRSMTVYDIARHLDAPLDLLQRGSRTRGEARHRTLRDALRWSYDLLEPGEQALFERLSVFAGTFTAQATAEVCGNGDADDLCAAHGLDALVGRSMVVADRSATTTRYGLLMTMREFGAEILDANGAADHWRDRHGAMFLATSEALDRQLSASGVPAVMGEFRNAWDDLRAAFNWLASRGDVDGCLRLVVSCSTFAALYVQPELLTWTARARALPGAPSHRLWPAATVVASIHTTASGDAAHGVRLALEAVAAERQRRRPPSFASRSALLSAYHMAGRLERERELLPTVLEMAQRSGSPLAMARAGYAAVIAHFATDIDLAADFAEELACDAEGNGHPIELSFAYTAALVIAVMRDRWLASERLARARRWCELSGNRLLLVNLPLWMAVGLNDEPRHKLGFVRQSLVLAREMSYWGNLEMILQQALMPLVDLGDHRSAAVLLGGIVHEPTDANDAVPRVRTRLAALVDPQLDLALAEGRRLSRSALAQFAVDAIDTLLKDEE